MKKALNSNDIYFHNDYFDEVANDPDKYEYDIIFDVSFLSIAHRKKLLDYLFKEFILTSYNDILLFKTGLNDYNMYEEYVQSIINGNDNFLKTCLILYLEHDLKDNLFKNNREIVNVVINSNEEEVLKLANLLNISQFKCDEETFDYLKTNFKKILYEYNKNESNENNDKLLENYYKIMDNNQRNLGNSKILKNYK